jgi:ATP-binding cassette, subfamily B, bacterial PglK
MRLLAAYLGHPYVYYLQRNSSELGKNLLYEVSEVAARIVQPALDFTARAVVSASILALLVWIDPLLAACLFLILGGCYYLIYSSAHRILARTGDAWGIANAERFKVSTEAFAAIKDVKLMRLEQNFLRRFERPSHSFSRQLVTHQLIALLPTYAMEVLAFGGILLIVLYYMVLGQAVTAVLPLLGVYGYAMVRLKPSLQGMFNDLTQMRFFGGALDRLYTDLQQHARTSVSFVEDSAAPMPLEDRIELRNVRFAYPDTEPLFEDLSLEIPAGSAVGFVGPTGSGKTTAVDVLLGLLRPQAGEIVVDGTPITDDRLAAWQANLGYVPQHIHLADDTLACNIALGVPEDEVDMDRVRKAARIAALHATANALVDGYHTVVGERGIRLSGGERQRVGIARALYRDPQVIVFDEATSALDNETERAVMQAVERLRGTRTLIIIAHRLSTVMACDRLFFLDNGRVAASGTYDELQQHSAAFKRMAEGTHA